MFELLKLSSLYTWWVWGKRFLCSAAFSSTVLILTNIRKISRIWFLISTWSNSSQLLFMWCLLFATDSNVPGTDGENPSEPWSEFTVLSLWQRAGNTSGLVPYGRSLKTWISTLCSDKSVQHLFEIRRLWPLLNWDALTASWYFRVCLL